MRAGQKTEASEQFIALRDRAVGGSAENVVVVTDRLTKSVCFSLLRCARGCCQSKQPVARAWVGTLSNLRHTGSVVGKFEQVIHKRVQKGSNFATIALVL